jgi:hypothetical protein
MAAIILLITIFSASHLIQPAIQAIFKGVRWLLRLDGGGSRRVRGIADHVPVKEAVHNLEGECMQECLLSQTGHISNTAVLAMCRLVLQPGVLYLLMSCACPS